MDAIEDLLKWVEIRKNVIKEMRKAADTLEQSHRHQQQSSVDSAAINIGVSLVGLASVVFAPATGGASLVLNGSTCFGAFLSYWSNREDEKQDRQITNRVGNEIDILQQNDETAKQKVLKTFKFLESILEEVKIVLSREEVRSFVDVLKGSSVDLQLHDVGEFKAAFFLVRCITAGNAIAKATPTVIRTVRNLVIIKTTVLQATVIRSVQFGSRIKIIQEASLSLCKVAHDSYSVTKSLGQTVTKVFSKKSVVSSLDEIVKVTSKSASSGAVKAGSISVAESTKITARSQTVTKVVQSQTKTVAEISKASFLVSVALLPLDVYFLLSAIEKSEKPMEDVAKLRQAARDMEKQLLEVEQECLEKYELFRGTYDICSDIYACTKDPQIYEYLEQTHGVLKKNLLRN